MRARKRCHLGVSSTDSQPSSSTAGCQQLQQSQHRLFHCLYRRNRDSGSASSAATKQLKACLSRYFTSRLFLLPSILLMALTGGSPTVNGALFLAAKRSGGPEDGSSFITIGAMDESLRLSLNNRFQPLIIPTTVPPLPFFLRPSIQHQLRYQLPQAAEKKNPSSHTPDGFLLVEVDTRQSALRPLNNNRTTVDNEKVPLRRRNTITAGSYFANDNDVLTGNNNVMEFKTDNNIYVPSLPPSLPSSNTLFDVAQQRRQRLLQRGTATNSLDTMQLLLSAPKKRNMRRCGKVLVKHIQNVCNGCLRGPETEPLYMRERRSGLVGVRGSESNYFRRLMKRDGTAINKITEMCCTERTCTDDEIRPYCC